jgi:O-acetyl-ADP-ribose deacetylase (regulator of RNase III)
VVIVSQEREEEMMATIIYRTGDMFASQVQAIVNPVNLRGAMGRGIAEVVRERYPEVYEAYRQRCRDGRLVAGRIQICKSASHVWVINLPTKGDWREPASLVLIEQGLRRFCKCYREAGIESVAFPRIGCGLGRLSWEDEVKPMLLSYLEGCEHLFVELYQ